MDTHLPGQPGPSPTGDPGAPPPSTPSPSGVDGFFAAIRRTGLFRSDDRWLGGVAGGLALRFGIDPLLARGVFAVSFLLGGLGLVAYGIAWALLPEQHDGRIHAEELIRGNFDGALLGALAMVVIGLNRGDGWFGWWGGSDLGWLTGLLWAIALAVVAVLVVMGINQSRSGKTPGGPSWLWADATVTPPGSTAAPGATSTPQSGDEPPYGRVPPYAASPQYPAPSQHRSSPQYASASPQYPTSPQYPPPPQHPASQQYPPSPPKPAKPSPRGPSVATTGVITALILLTFAGLMVADRFNLLHPPVLLTGAGLAVILLGLGVVFSGLRGRTSGALGGLAIVAIIVAAPVALLDKPMWNADGSWRVISDDSFMVSTRDAATAGFNVGVGDSVIDLTEVPLTDEMLVVPITAGVGSIRIVIPDGVPVSAEIRAGAGEIRWEVDGESLQWSGVGIGPQRYSTEEVTDRAEAQIMLRVDVGVGEVDIEED